MEEMPLQNLNNPGNEQPFVPSNSLLTKRLVVLLLVLAVITITGAGYFLIGKTSKNTNVVSGWKYYRMSNNVAYFQNREIIGADASTFQELGDRWAKDKNFVYWEGVKQTYLDPATVRVFPYGYVVDKSAVWVYLTGYYMEVDKTDANPSTFSVISHGYGKDANNVYYFAQKIVNADVSSFMLLRGANYPLSEGLASNWYAKDKNNVYYGSSVIQNADMQSFAYLGSEYAKDKNKVYYEGEVLADADATNFALVDDYAKDSKHIFRSGKILNIEIDPATFVVIDRGVIKDNKRVYFHSYDEDKYDLTIGVDAPTFQSVGTCASFEMSKESYYKDKNHVFTQNISGGNPVNPVNVIDVSSFEYLGDYGPAEGIPYSVSYAKDKNNIYSSCGKILDNADVSTFVDLNDGYVKDKSKVWYLADMINGADVATFQSLGRGYAKDKSHPYFAGAVIKKADVATFIIVKEKVATNEYGSVYAKDKNNVYSGSEIIEGVNPENCTVESIENCSPNP